jgi:hypothetical protein
LNVFLHFLTVFLWVLTIQLGSFMIKGRHWVWVSEQLR